MLYSKQTGGFYDPLVHSVLQIPPDAVELTDDEYNGIYNKHSAGNPEESRGFNIGGDENGNPILVDPPPPSEEQLAEANKAAAKLALADSDITVLRCYENDIPVPADVVSYRKVLRAIVNGESAEVVPAKPNKPEGI